MSRARVELGQERRLILSNQGYKKKETPVSPANGPSSASSIVYVNGPLKTVAFAVADTTVVHQRSYATEVKKIIISSPAGLPVFYFFFSL